MFAAGWMSLSALVWQRPGPPLPDADDAVASAAAPFSAEFGRIAPITTAQSDAALASALGRIIRQIDKWPPTARQEPLQRARNLLPITAVRDLYDTETLQSHLPLLVEAELERRLPADQLPTLLASIAVDRDAGSVAARASLASLGLPASTGDQTRVRGRTALYPGKPLVRRTEVLRTEVP